MKPLLFMAALSTTLLSVCPSSLLAEQTEAQKLTEKKEALEKEAAQIRADIAVDQERLQRLQQQIDEWRAKNGAIDSQLIDELKKSSKAPR
ncbi:MAG: hypothetical protein MI754_14440 [Chromatiales bacterium]|nr:hypothetical protein [Chromatiales bacterium]